MDVESLAKQMLDEFRIALGGAWSQVRAFAEPEAKKIALSVTQIEVALANHEITDVEARALLDIQKNASRSVLTASKVIGVVEAEKAINAALALLTAPLKSLLGNVLV